MQIICAKELMLDLGEIATFNVYGSYLLVGT